MRSGEEPNVQVSFGFSYECTPYYISRHMMFLIYLSFPWTLSYKVAVFPAFELQLIKVVRNQIV